MAEQWEVSREVLEKEFRVVAVMDCLVFHRCGVGERTKCGGHWDYSLALPEARKEGMRPCKICMRDAYEPKWKYDPAAPRIEDVAAELGREVPPEEWAKVPDDLTDQLDHYIYGTPKKGD